jgi:hypothetical protein
MDDELDKLAANWTKTLLDDLADPTTQENLALLTAERRKQVESLVKSRQLPDKLSQSFIQAVKEALSGLVRVVRPMSFAQLFLPAARQPPQLS